MLCENCIDIEEQDGIPAPCRSPRPMGEGQGEGVCPIPPLTPDERRILEMRGMLIQLKDLVDPGTVLMMHGADIGDLKILAAIEAGLKEKK